jgi:hypothetical protein
MVEFDLVDANAQSNCTPSATSIAGIGGVTQVADGLIQTRKYMSGENNWVQLDGSFYTPPKPSDDSLDSIGWWSDCLSDSNGHFSDAPVLTLTQSEPFTSLGLTFIFSPLTGDFCNSIQIVTTDVSNNQNTYSVSPNSASYFWSQQLNEIVSVVVTFHSTNNPLRRVHLSEVIFGEQFLWSGENIFDLDVLEEFDPLCNTAPPKEAHASVANNLNSFNLYLNDLQKKQPLKPYLNLIFNDGTSETVPMGTFYLYNWRNDPNYLSSTLFARDLLDLMDGTTFYTYTYSGATITLYDLAESIIKDFESQATLNVNYSMDQGLQTISTTGVLSSMTHHDALMYVAQAGMAVLYVDRYNVLRITQSQSQKPLYPMPYSDELTLAMQETYPKVAIQDLYNYFTVNIYTNDISDSPGTVYSGTVQLNGDEVSLWVKYTSPASASSCLASVSGATLVSAEYYTDSAYLTLNGSGNAAITITGNSVESNSVQSVLNVAGSQPVNEVDLDNPLITTAAMAANVLSWYATECANGYLYQVESWMNPSLEVGDVIYWDTQYATEIKQAKIIRQEFRFGGTLSGTINGKGWT